MLGQANLPQNDGPIRQNTPFKVKNTASARYWTHDMQSARTAVAKDLLQIPIVSLQFFFDSVIPHVENATIQNIRKKLEASGCITQKGCIKSFTNEPCYQSGKTETAPFRPLQTFMDGAIQACVKFPGREKHMLDFVNKPNSSPMSEWNNDSRPDCYLKLTEREEAWDSIVFPIEVKVIDNATNRHDNELKTIWSGHHILRNDPCRRFSFGMTIENTQARIWYFCRSHVMVSEPFDFTKELDRFLHIVIGFSLSSQETLGYDSTIRRVKTDPRIQYEIQVDGDWGIITQVLSGFEADAICGRATRVWEGFLKGDPETKYAIKDVWLLDDAQNEAAIWGKLAAEIPNDVMNKHFLTVVKDEEVCTSNGKKATTLEFMRQRRLDEHTIIGFLNPNLHVKTRSIPYRMDRGSCSMRAIPVGAPSLDATAQLSGGETRSVIPPELRFQARKQYRIIFKEICTPYHELNKRYGYYD